MQLSRILFGLAWLLLPVALSGTTWLYLYPFFHGCAFPQPNNTSLPLLSSQAPFRLLALGDPQLEGDSSLPDPNAPVFPSLENVLSDLRNANYDPPDVRDILLAAATGAVKDLGAWLEGYRKTVDLWGNDWYLAHIVRSLRWWTEPTHISVLGDLLGSQWITDGEFEKRAGRYWGTVMRGLEKVPDATMGVYVESDHYDEPEHEQRKTWGGTTEVLGADKAWEKRVINIAGNHDIGYAGDIDNARVDRFERAFGSVNWDMWLTLPSGNTSNSTDDTDNTSKNAPALRLVVLNTMNLDTPAYTDSLQQETYAFMNHIITTSRPVTDKTHATILLTHIPLHKAPGVCVDSPYFDYFEGGHGVREQNMLSEHGSKIVLESIFGLSADVHAEGAGQGRRGVVVNGHDHEGCDVLHWIRQPGAASPCTDDDTASENDTATEHANTDTTPDPSTPDIPPNHDHEPAWNARPYPLSSPSTCSPHLREITLRSIMGDFSGHAGFLSAWFEPSRGEKGEWVIEFASCGVGVQHWWWGVHVVDLVLVVAVLGGVVARAVEEIGVRGVPEEGEGGRAQTRKREGGRPKKAEREGGRVQQEEGRGDRIPKEELEQEQNAKQKGSKHSETDKRGGKGESVLLDTAKTVEMRIEPGARSLRETKRV